MPITLRRSCGNLHPSLPVPLVGRHMAEHQHRGTGQRRCRRVACKVLMRREPQFPAFPAPALQQDDNPIEVEAPKCEQFASPDAGGKSNRRRRGTRRSALLSRQLQPFREALPDQAGSRGVQRSPRTTFRRSGQHRSHSPGPFRQPDRVCPPGQPKAPGDLQLRVRLLPSRMPVPSRLCTLGTQKSESDFRILRRDRPGAHQGQ